MEYDTLEGDANAGKASMPTPKATKRLDSIFAGMELRVSRIKFIAFTFRLNLDTDPSVKFLSNLTVANSQS